MSLVHLRYLPYKCSYCQLGHYSATSQEAERHQLRCHAQQTPSFLTQVEPQKKALLKTILQQSLDAAAHLQRQVRTSERGICIL